MEEKALVKSLTDRVKLTNMHAFNAKGQITKYDSLNAILREYAEVRLALYETRRQKQIADLKAELPYHEDVMRFIEDQVADKPTLDFRKKARDICEAALVAQKYRRVSDSFDYIFRLPVSSFTAEQIDKHAKKLAELRAEIVRLESTTAAALWLTELSGV
jgi:DNA gyrase/topoisomerase IV subunit A